MTTTSLLTRPRPARVASGTTLTVRPCDRRDVAELIAMTGADDWPILSLEAADEAPLPGVDGASCLILLALDQAGRCMGLASYDRVERSSGASFAVDTSDEAHEHGVAGALVRRLAAEAVRHGITELRGWVSPEQAQELLDDASAGRFHLATAGGRCLVVVSTGEGSAR